MPDSPGISIVIPVLNEAEFLDSQLRQLFAHSRVAQDCEVIVCDGGSEDDSARIAQRFPCRLLHSEAGRATQMNAASAIASGETLLFLHADSQLPESLGAGFPGDADWGFFRLRLNGPGFLFRSIELAINLRSRASHIGGGDQGLYFRRSFFDSIGGFPSIPLMEDIAICKRARSRSKPAVVKNAITTSARRWQNRGILKTVLLMWWLRFAFWLGVDPQHLHKIYYPGPR